MAYRQPQNNVLLNNVSAADWQVVGRNAFIVMQDEITRKTFPKQLVVCKPCSLESHHSMETDASGSSMMAHIRYPNSELLNK